MAIEILPIPAIMIPQILAWPKIHSISLENQP